MSRDRRDAIRVGALALAVRLAIVLWAGSRFPPAADGSYFHTLGARLAAGHGYTWLWPDGAVTYAAHYPVGYPALVALSYLIAGGPHPAAAMILNAIIGSLGASATYALLAPITFRRRAVAGALLVALHPALVPYTAALMTEGVTASLWICAAALAARRRPWSSALVLGLATLVRPQSIVLAPLLGWLSVEGSAGRRAWQAARAAAIVLVFCAPWTARNCVRMHRCALVSVNGGWNLLIGAQTESGAWEEVRVPDACRVVWDEAEKDACFGRAAKETIAEAPLAWVAKMPGKVGVTFDYFGAAPWYLHTARADYFSDRAKVALGVAETFVSRLSLLLALAAAAAWEGPRKRARWILAGLGALSAIAPWGWPAYLALAAALFAARPKGGWPPEELLLPFSAGVVLSVALVHAVFFGAGRYGLVVVPFVSALAALASFARSNASPPERSPSRSISSSSG